MKSALRIYTLLFCLVLCVCLTPAVFADGESITLPENTTVIQDEAFLNCASMTSVTIPASVTHIGDRAFSGCDNLTFVFYNGTPEQWHKVNIGDGNEALANIICNDDRFPDTYFRAYVYHHFDTDKNAFISDEEISAVTIIDCSGSEEELGLIVSLRGIELFSNLETLFCRYNQLTDLDVSTNTKLKYLDCRRNQLTSLDLRKNTAITTFSCDYNQLTSLLLGTKENLWNFGAMSNQLTSLDVSGLHNLKVFGCGDNQLEEINLSNNPNLYRIHLWSNNLTSLDISQNSKLVYLDVRDNPFTTLNISRSPDIMDLVINGTKTEKTYKGHIFDVYISEKVIQGEEDTHYTLTVDKNVEIRFPDGVPINETTFPDTIFRSYVSTNYDTDGNSFLSGREIALIRSIGFDNQDTPVTSLKGIEYFTGLNILYCINQMIKELDLSNNTALQYVICENNQLASLDLSNCTVMKSLWCGDNQLTSLTISNCPALTYLSCYENQLTSVTVSNCPALTDDNIYCDEGVTIIR